MTSRHPRRHLRRHLLALIAGSLLAGPAFAQQGEPPLPDPNDQSDTFTIAAGGAYVPDYEGSDDYKLIPAAAIRGRVGGLSFFSRATYLYLDLIPSTGKVDFDFGPIAGVRLNRTGKIEDDVVRRLGKLDTAIEVGAFAGVTFKGLTNPYDALSLRLDMVKDVGGAHEALVVSPTLDFGTPLSRRTYVGASLSADFVGDKYARYYFGVTPAGALASGLAPYQADGGFKSWKVGLLVNQSVTGDLTHGLSIFATGSYSRLQGDFKRSPIVAERGSASQWLGALGLAYTF